MLELADAGFRVALSHRTPIHFGVDDWLWPFIYRNFVHLEKLKLMLSAGRARALDVRMAGGRAKQLIQSGAVATFPAIARFEKDAVVFTNGERLTPGIVLYTTGFAPALRHLAKLDLMLCSETGTPLAHQMESTSVPNLFFLGFEMLRNFQSRFLRGIRNDAVVLADRIANRLANGASVPASLPTNGSADFQIGVF
jgi:putative flavoprotein involved in K+ transport